MDFVIDFEGNVGMRMKGKWWKVIDNHFCFLADKTIEELFTVVRDWTKTARLSFFDRKVHTGILRYAVIRVTKTGESMLNIVTSAPANKEEEATITQALKDLAKKTSVSTLIWAINSTITDVSFGDDLRVISGSGFMTEEINGFKYIVTPQAFFQTNSHGAEYLLLTVSEMVGNVESKTLLDLYCGSGFFSIALAKQTKKTIGIELNEQAIVDAKQNVLLNNISGDIEYFDAKTEDFDWKNLGADVVILDPPRSGMHDKALADVLSAKPKTIVYVSCNYKNFAREMVQLQEYYDVEAIKAIDMFPHTPHVELVTKLVLK